MTENSKIEWTHHTYNPWIGCQKVGPGCDHCYAETWDARFNGARWGANAERKRTSPANRNKPIIWNRKAMTAGERHRVFCASLADVFDNHTSILPEWRADLWAMIRQTSHLDWMLLTKRPGNIARMLPPDWGNGYPNVWLGCTVVNQAEADRDIPKLLAVPAKVRFLSMEPLLGPVDLTEVAVARPDLRASVVLDVLRGTGGFDGPPGRIDLVIVGGESGPHARPMHPDWARGLRDQCQAAGVAFHFKQWGGWGAGSVLITTGEPVFRQFRDFQQWVNKAPTWVNGGICLDADGLQLKNGGDFMRARDAGKFPVTVMHRIGKKASGRMLDGRTWDQMPGEPTND